MQRLIQNTSRNIFKFRSYKAPIKPFVLFRRLAKPGMFISASYIGYQAADPLRTSIPESKFDKLGIKIRNKRRVNEEIRRLINDKQDIEVIFLAIFESEILNLNTKLNMTFKACILKSMQDKKGNKDLKEVFIKEILPVIARSDKQTLDLLSFLFFSREDYLDYTQEYINLYKSVFNDVDDEFVYLESDGSEAFDTDSPIGFAAVRACGKIVKMLIEAGSNDATSSQIFSRAVACGSSEIVSLLMAQGAGIGTLQSTAILPDKRFYKDRLKIINLLLAKGLNPKLILEGVLELDRWGNTTGHNFSDLLFSNKELVTSILPYVNDLSDFEISILIYKLGSLQEWQYPVDESAISMFLECIKKNGYKFNHENDYLALKNAFRYKNKIAKLLIKGGLDPYYFIPNPGPDLLALLNPIYEEINKEKSASAEGLIKLGTSYKF